MTLSSPIKLIILDRDGVINRESPNAIRSPEAWQPLPGSLESIARLTKRGYTLAVATNQSGIARGYYTEEMLARIHDKMCRTVKAAGGVLSVVRYCPHDNEAGCLCRKPQPGLLLDIMQTLAISSENTLMIGDSLRDLEAARRAGCRRALVKTGYGASTLESYDSKGNNVLVFADLADVVENHPDLT